MSRFVDQCRNEWGRLGVPDAEANEMAADLEADLAEAQAEGASPEDVLGNGYFDAKSFAASWATARGVVRLPTHDRTTIRVRSLLFGLSALIGVVITVVGALILVGPHFDSSAIAIAHTAPRFNRPPIAINPHRFFFGGPGSAIDPLGWVLLLAGLNGLVVILFLWRPWSTHRDRPGFDRNVGMPSFL